MFANSVRQGLRAASRQSVRGLATQPARAAPRYGAAAAAAAVAGFALYQSTQAIRMEGKKTIAGEYKTDTERSFIMVKPDGTARGISTKVLSRFEEKGYKIVALKMLTPSKELAKEHYADLKERPFYPALVDYITSGVPVVAFVIEGQNAIKMGRMMVGATNPLEAGPGSIRGDYAVTIGRNIVHASDSFESATKEIGLWFKEEEINSYKLAAWDWIMANN